MQLFRRCLSPERFLVLQRNQDRGGFWQPVTGAPLPEESDIDAAICEVREETGVDVTDTIFALKVTYRYVLDPRRAAHWERLYGPGVTEIAVTAFAAEVTENVPHLDGIEHQAFRWLTYDQAASALDWPVEPDALAGRLAALEALRRHARL